MTVDSNIQSKAHSKSTIQVWASCSTSTAALSVAYKLITAKEIMDNKTNDNKEEKGKHAKEVSDEEKPKSNSTRKSRTRKRNIMRDRTEIGDIRKTIYQYYVDEKESPTVSTLLEILEEDGFVYDREYFKELLNKIGFCYVRCQSPSRRHFLTEKNDLGYKRLKYIEHIREYRTQNRNVCFMHETFMEAGDVRKADRYLKAEIPAKIDENERLVIVHFGGSSGLTKGTFTTIKSDSESGDHFAEVNQPKFEKWVNENLKDKLQPDSVIVVSSAPYHSIQKDMRPRDMFASERDVQGWLMRHNVEFREDMFKAELLELARKAPIKPVYVFDEVLKGLGHTVLRVPPQHPELNPLEFVWADIKKKLARTNAEASPEEKRKIWEKLYLEYPAANWEHWADEVKNTENEYFHYIYKLDDIVDDIIGRYEKDSNSDSETCESDPNQSDSMSE